ncbi:ATP-binding protein [Marinobacter sp. BW6]|uniref:sensor histidine kinase n=1 Tax=Marinobacter sp. BW6 TaxID=2592624 RepID=UPI001F07E725|nr:ATP-binding protein [Marinobacter sp. BW6]
MLDNAGTESHRADVRQEWQTRLNDLSLKLQGTILQNVQTVWGLAANVAVQPNITETRFQQLASVIFELAPQLRNIGLAPDLTIRNIYPLAGNEAAIGLDLTRQSISPAQVQMLQTSGRALFSGPINLVQGGQGMAARVPIFEKDSGRFWGVISVILDLNRLYNAIELRSFMGNGQLALFRTDATETQAEPFFGDVTVEWREPVKAELDMSGVSWTLRAQPEQGWPNQPESPMLVRSILGLLVALIFAVTFWLTSLLLRDHQMQRRFWGLFELAPFGIGLYDSHNNRLLRANNSFKNIFGNKADDLNFFNNHYDPAGRECPSVRDIVGDLQRDLSFRGLEGYYPGTNDQLTPILLQGLTLDTEHGEPVIWLIAGDMSEQKKADRVKNEFISIVSHELRTPLTSIAGSLGLLSNNAVGELPPKASRLAQIAYRNTQHLAALINDLLDVEKLMAGKMVFQMSDCHVAELVRECVEGIESFSLEKGVTLKTECLHNDIVRADHGRLCQALNNLLSNAIKFSFDNSEVTVFTEKSNGAIQIYVCNQGRGIPSEFKDRIFQKFSQADAPDRNSRAGTGLGLAITRELMHGMAGEVDFNSEEGEGACFWLSLPLADQT